MTQAEIIQQLNQLAMHFGPRWLNQKLQDDIITEVQLLPLEFFVNECVRMVKIRPRTAFASLQDFVAMKSRFEMQLKQAELKMSAPPKNRWNELTEPTSSIFSRLYGGATNVLDALKIEKERIKRK